MKKRIVITGLGPVGSPGVGKESFWNGVVRQRTGVESVENVILREQLESFYLHKVNNFNINDFNLDPDDLDYIHKWKEGDDNRDLFFLLAAIKLALEDSKIDYKKSKIALIATHENPGLEQLLWKVYRCSYQLLKGNLNLNEKDFCYELTDKIMKTAYETQTFMVLFHIARTFCIHEYSLFISNACASGLYAVETASDLIRLGKVNQAIVVAGDCPDIFKHLWFKMIGMYASDGKIKPFDKNAKGFIMGEGATALILEDYEHAKKRNAHIYAEYLGGGFKLEGWGITTPMIGGCYYKEAIVEALTTANIKKEEIDLICAHGVGTSANDYYESQGIQQVFDPLRTPVTALKPYVGHNLGGSTLIEIAILLLAMEHNTIPPVLNTNQIDPKIKLNLITREMKQEIKIILKTCSAFAGYNAALIFKKI